MHQPISPPKTTTALPLAVDLDGTLIRSDVFTDGILRFVCASPFNVFKFIGWLMRGLPYAKARVAHAAPFDAASLPYDERVVGWLHEERTRGRHIVLATAADEYSARAVADHVGVFEDVYASNGEINLKSRRKAERLQKAFPEGFVYAGNETPDLKVWAAAAGAVVVNASGGLTRGAAQRCEIEREFAPVHNPIASFIKAIRVRQWAKNALVFLAMLTGQGWTNPEAWREAIIAFFAVSFAASSIYLLNDVVDIDADRHHATKRKRPFASGALSPLVAIVAAPLLLAAGVGLGVIANVGALVALYVVISALYTFWLKQKLLADVFVLASLYTLRVVIGGVATGYAPSNWLLAFCCFFFLSLALVKRATEIDTAAARGQSHLNRRGYRASDGDIIKMMGLATGFVSSLVLALYLQSPEVAARYSAPLLLWGLPILVVYWLGRVWILADRGEMHDDPLMFALRDRVSWYVAACMGLTFLAAVVAPENFLGL